jgi:hypothetical protein
MGEPACGTDLFVGRGAQSSVVVCAVDPDSRAENKRRVDSRFAGHRFHA